MKASDTVKIISGKHKGQTAKIVKIDRKKDLVFLEEIGVLTRNIKKSQRNPEGGKKTVHLGIHISNVKLKESAPAPKSKKSGAKTKITADTKKSAKKKEKK